MTWRIEVLQHTHDYVQNQITLADAKAAGILAWNAALIAILSQAPSPEQAMGLVFALATGACVILSVVYCAYVLIPRTPASGPGNQASYVDIAQCNREKYTNSAMCATEGECSRDLARHIHLLSAITDRKFCHVLWAVRLSAVATAFLVLSILL